MSQKTLNGKTDCREERKKGSVRMRYKGKNQAMIDSLKKLKEDHPCFVISINGDKLDEKPKEWKSLDQMSR